MSRPTLTYVTAVIRRHRAAIGSAWRKLNPGRQALLVLVYLRKVETFAEVAAGFGGVDRDGVAARERGHRFACRRAPKLGRALR